MLARAAVLTGAALLFGAPLPLSSQSHAGLPRQPWWRSTEIQSEMTLTARQVEELDGIYRESLPARRRLRAQLGQMQASLTALLKEGRLDDAQARRVIERVFAVEKQRNVARTMMLVRMYRVLTPGQRTRLDTLSVGISSPDVPR